MNRRQRQEFYENFVREFPDLHEEDMKKLQFARNLTKELLLFYDYEGNDQIQIGPLEKETFEFFIFIILLEYESMDCKS